MSFILLNVVDAELHVLIIDLVYEEVNTLAVGKLETTDVVQQSLPSLWVFHASEHVRIGRPWDETFLLHARSGEHGCLPLTK